MSDVSARGRAGCFIDDAIHLAPIGSRCLVEGPIAGERRFIAQSGYVCTRVERS
jgi:hypothetical protein